MKKTALLLVLALFATETFASFSISVNNPKKWGSLTGVIENATLVAQPAGVHINYDLYLTFSARSTSLATAKDTLEVVMSFDLPASAVVHDSWLWIGNDIIKADLLDVWTAKTTYEGIVKRQKDPSILTKQSATNYQLRVYPMLGDQTRKVKISYMVPAEWTKNTFTSSLPVEILSSSKFKTPLSILTPKTTQWGKPYIHNNDKIVFKETTDTITSKEYYHTYIPVEFLNTNLRLAFKNPAQNGYLFSSQQKDVDDGCYQFIVFPGQFIGNDEASKIAVLFDYQKENSALSRTEMLKIVKTNMQNILTDRDSFNLILTGAEVKRLSNQWVQATAANIDSAFLQLSDSISQKTNLTNLLKSGFSFINEQGKTGNIVLISCSDSTGSEAAGNKLLEDIAYLNFDSVPIHISDLQNLTFPKHVIKSNTLYGNEYVYYELSRRTGGSYQRFRDEYSIKGILNVASDVTRATFDYAIGLISDFDVDTRMHSGYTFNEYNLSENKLFRHKTEPFLITGRYYGELPFSVKISGRRNNKFYTQTIDIPVQNQQYPDEFSEKIWSAQYINELESAQQKSYVINEILASSLKFRVLSRYTSFLCLEDTSKICHDCYDESLLVMANEEISVEEDLIVVFPNPFSDLLTLELTCNDPGKVQKLAIYDLNGTLIHAFDISALQYGVNTLRWDSSQLKSGVYLLVYNNGFTSKTIKILKH